MANRINFANKINDSVQVGDELHWGVLISGVVSIPTQLGLITAVGDKYVEVDSVGNATYFDYFFFKKVNTSTTNTDNVVVNSYSKSGTKGYYASVKMSTSETSKTKLFALGSEVATSSK